MGEENSAGDLLTMCTLKNTDAARSFPYWPAQSTKSNANYRLLYDMLFWVLNNGTNTSILTSANISKLHCVIHFNTLLPYILRLKGKPPTNAYSKRSGAKITMSTSFQCLILHCSFLANPDSTILTPKDSLGWHKLLVTGTTSV